MWRNPVCKAVAWQVLLVPEKISATLTESGQTSQKRSQLPHTIFLKLRPRLLNLFAHCQSEVSRMGDGIDFSVAVLHFNVLENLEFAVRLGLALDRKSVV